MHSSKYSERYSLRLFSLRDPPTGSVLALRLPLAYLEVVGRMQQ